MTDNKSSVGGGGGLSAPYGATVYVHGSIVADNRNLIDAVYAKVITAGTRKASSIRIAEAAKVIENIQRDVNIALVNELATSFDDWASVAIAVRSRPSPNGELEQMAADRVRISGVRGEAPPSTLKVAMNEMGGYRNDIAVALTGLDIEAKAEVVAAAFWAACPYAPDDFASVTTRLIRSEHDDPEANEGSLQKGSKVTVMSTGRSYQADRVGVFTPKMHDRGELRTGEVGFVIAAIKDIYGAPVGDTLTATRNPCEEPLPGFKQVQPRAVRRLDQHVAPVLVLSVDLVAK